MSGMDERAVAGFLEAVGAGGAEIVFRRAGTDWSVSTAGGGVLWTSKDYPLPGRMLYAQLTKVLAAHRPDITLRRDIVTEEDWAWYADD